MRRQAIAKPLSVLPCACDGGMSHAATHWAMQTDAPTPAAKLVLLILADAPTAIEDLTYLSRLACCSRAEVMDALDALSAAGFLIELAAMAAEPTAAPRGKSKGGRIWPATRARIYERDAFACVYCGSAEDITIDHVVPRVAGGRSHADNLATACRTCNSSKGGRTPQEWRS